MPTPSPMLAIDYTGRPIPLTGGKTLKRLAELVALQGVRKTARRADRPASLVSRHRENLLTLSARDLVDVLAGLGLQLYVGPAEGVASSQRRGS